MNLTKTLMTAAALTALTLPLSAEARLDGVDAGRLLGGRAEVGCGGCHGGSASRSTVVAFDGPESLEAGETAEYTLTVTNAASVGAGAVVASSDGLLTPGEGLGAFESVLLHVSPVEATNGVTTFTFSLTAPEAPGTVTLNAAGNAINGDFDTSGDGWNLGSLEIEVVEATKSEGGPVVEAPVETEEPTEGTVVESPTTDEETEPLATEETEPVATMENPLGAGSKSALGVSTGCNAAGASGLAAFAFVLPALMARRRHS